MSKEKTIELAHSFMLGGQLQLARRLAQKIIKMDKCRINELAVSDDAVEAIKEIEQLERIYK